MSSKLPSKKASASELQAFLKKVDSTPALHKGSQGRLVFAMDATASREHCWDMASANHAQMFAEAEKLNSLSVQLCYYRGFGEFKALPWSSSSADMKNALLSVRCLAGKTQISKVLKHVLVESSNNKVSAVVFVGDCVEESPDVLGDLAGQLGIRNVPIFLFQEGYDQTASRTFAHLAKLSRGAHCQFGANSAKELGALLAAVAVYASGGKNALKQNLLSQSSEVKKLLSQL